MNWNLNLRASQTSARPFTLPGICLGTSSFTAAGWKGSFYPLGMRSKDFLRHYASQFQTVEIDSTFYGTPAASTVTNRNEKTPRDFIFAVKVPQVITHEKVLVDCEPEFDEFIENAFVGRQTRPDASAIPEIRQMGT